MSECKYDCLKKVGMCNGELPSCATDIEEAAKTNIQQLKAEIAALVTEFCSTHDTSVQNVYNFTQKLRQLSAI